MNRQLALGLCAFCVLPVRALAADAAPAGIVISQPAPQATLSKTVVVEAAAASSPAPAKLWLKVDGVSCAPVFQGPPYRFELNTSTLANGPHTISAVGTDDRGNVLRSPLVSVTVTNPLSFTLGEPPFNVEDLGSLMAVNTQEKQIMFRLPNGGDQHLLLYYCVVDVWKYPFQILDVNLTKGSARLLDGLLGRPGVYGTVLYPNGKVYLGSSDPGYLMEYDPATGATNFIGKLHPTLRRDTQTMEIGDDGWVYIGEYSPLGGGVARYHPATARFEDLGLMDPKYAAPQYAYTIGADQRYVYVGLGQSPWYLAVYDTQTQERKLYWDTELDTDGTIYHGKAGGWFYYRTTASNARRWYQLTNGVPVELTTAAVPAKTTLYAPWQERAATTLDQTLFADNFKLELNLDNAYPDSSSNHVQIQWRTSGATTWQSAEASGFRLQPVNLKRLYPWDNRRLFGFADFYGPVFLYDLQTKTTVTLGRPQFSLYDAAFEAGALYLSGYPATTLAYNSAAPWTLTGSTLDKASTQANPRKVAAAFGKYHYYSCFGADGWLYLGSQHERDSTGGELGWYDPVTGTAGSLREPFVNNSVRDLKSALGGTKLLYAANSGKLFVFDVASKTLERTIVPLGEGTALDKVVEVAPGIAFGAANQWIFSVDIRSGAVLYKRPLPGPAFGGALLAEYDHRLTLGPDGWVWLFAGNALYRVQPADGSMTRLAELTPCNLLFKGTSLYGYGGPNLYRIQGVLRQSLPPPDGLRVLGASQ